jgi:hypothetical protein
MAVYNTAYDFPVDIRGNCYLRCGDFKQDKILTFFSNNPNSQKSRWDADRQYVNSILQDGDELDFSIDEKNGVCDVLVTFANTTKNLKVQLTRKAGNE